MTLVLILGSIWWQLSENVTYVQNIMGVLFMTVALLSFVSFGNVPTYVEQRAIFNRYHSFPHFEIKPEIQFSMNCTKELIPCLTLHD